MPMGFTSYRCAASVIPSVRGVTLGKCPHKEGQKNQSLQTLNTPQISITKIETLEISQIPCDNGER